MGATVKLIKGITGIPKIVTRIKTGLIENFLKSSLYHLRLRLNPKGSQQSTLNNATRRTPKAGIGTETNGPNASVPTSRRTILNGTRS